MNRHWLSHPCLAKLGVHVRLTARANLLQVLVGIAARGVHEPFVQVDRLFRRRRVVFHRVAAQSRPFLSSHVLFIRLFVRLFHFSRERRLLNRGVETRVVDDTVRQWPVVRDETDMS